MIVLHNEYARQCSLQAQTICVVNPSLSVSRAAMAASGSGAHQEDAMDEFEQDCMYGYMYGVGTKRWSRPQSLG